MDIIILVLLIAWGRGCETKMNLWIQEHFADLKCYVQMLRGCGYAGLSGAAWRMGWLRGVSSDRA